MGGKDVRMKGNGLAPRQSLWIPASFRLPGPVPPTQREDEKGAIYQNSPLTLPAAELSFSP